MSGLIVGIGHKKRRGKDTAANRLVDKHKFIRVSWADNLKEAARIIFHFTNEQLYGHLKEVVDPRWGFTPRWALQRLGSEACRDNVDVDIWVKSAWLTIESLRKKNPEINIVIPDVRFPNEAQFLIDRGATLWRVDRDIVEDESSTHESEIALDNFTKWTHILNNNSSLQNLYSLVDGAFKQSKGVNLNDHAKRLNTRTNY